MSRRTPRSDVRTTVPLLVFMLLVLSAAAFGAGAMLLCRQRERVAEWSRLIGLACFVASLVTMLVLAVVQVTTMSRTVDSGPASKVDCGSLFGALNSPATVDAFPRAERNPAATPCREA